MTKKLINNINFTLILSTCLLLGVVSAADRVGGFAVLADNLSPYNIGSIFGGGFGVLLCSVILAVFFNFILNIIRRVRGREKKIYSYLQIWVFLLILVALKLLPLL